MNKRTLTSRNTSALDRSDIARVAVWSSVFLGAGVLHFVKPKPFDSLVPAQLPGTRRDWTLASGVMEIGLGASILTTATVPALRSTLHTVVGPATAIFLAGVWPGNIKMMVDYLATSNPKISTTAKAIAVARVPMQIPMMRSVLRLGSSAN
ncbi:hypothetical protein F7230_07610 [Corynebacterium sp. 320]|uniref:DoxX family protein n=1 Tax=Corynebacterium TaxID=1716 RepID=UPI00125CC56E|nr:MULTISPECIES: hypothetical protein [Corynebacterium]KAB1502853.1 hypothetical protein F7230_07610 [Corynebacterium sp. 320]KAB1552364.1 hypothetical protein F7233_00930 [Corynebacterium sp. 321]KAB1554421.1 hypothetical protein F7232_05665 [Corynebacterium sp. 319]KAB3526516.1 hypothetical protein F8354_07610 [Corynebacterium sp. 250]KAB3539836.1 hypothetical protein F8390_00665 [Corynebacterium sp. 366]